MSEKYVCDCHTWPTVEEFHSYCVALEKRHDEWKSLAGELTNYVSAWANFSNGEPEAKKLVAKAREMLGEIEIKTDPTMKPGEWRLEQKK